MALKLISGPTEEPVTIGEAKKHLRIEEDMTEEDSLILGCIKAAREYIEGFQNRICGEQTWELILDSFPKLPLELPKVSLISVESITYKDSTGIVKTFDPVNYLVDVESEPGRIAFALGKSWPNVELWPINAVRIQFKAGQIQVPEKVKQAIKLLVGHWYENREASLTGALNREIEFAVHALLWQDRRVPV